MDQPERRDSNNDKPSLTSMIEELDPKNFTKKTRASPHISNMDELAPAAKSDNSGVSTGIAGKKLAYTAGTCDATPDQ